MFSAGTSTFSNDRAASDEPRRPIFSSSRITLTPGDSSASTMNSRRPDQPDPGSTEATRAKKLAALPLVMKHFSPLMTYDPPLSTA